MAATCKECGAKLIWARTKSGAAMPLNFAVVAGVQPNIVLQGNVAHVVNPGNGTHVSHWATCPKSKEFRKPRDAG